MAELCCQMVGDLQLDLGLSGCIISFSTNCSTEVVVACSQESEPLEGPTTGSISIVGYASSEIWRGCPSRAGVSIPFIRKHDCDLNKVYFISVKGQGQSFYTGEAKRYVTLKKTLPTSCESLSASSQSGPASIYSRSMQINGYGMSYDGDPIRFDTEEDPDGPIISLGGVFSDKKCYLQNFSLELQPGQLPTASYSLVYSFI